MPASRRTWFVALVLLTFAAVCLTQLNSDVYMDPDSTEYILLARSIATATGYRDISRPDWPRNNLKPPGLPVLLAPAAAFFPYNVIAAKASMVFMATCLLAAFWQLANRVLRPTSALFVFVILATSPATFWFARDLLSEVPYTACTLALVALELNRSARIDKLSQRVLGFESPVRLVLWFALMAFVPFIRAVGLAFTIAMMLPMSNEWQRQNGVASTAGGWWKRALLVFATVSPFALWTVVCTSRQGELPYSSWFTLERFGAVWQWTYTSLGFYWDAVADYALGRVPVYLTVLLAVLPVLGMIATRRSGGFTMLAYFAIYLIVVSVYPCRHARLVWPLVPFALIWGARGLESLASRWLEPTRGTVVLKPVLFALGTLWSTAQVFVSANWIGMTKELAPGVQRWGDLPWAAWGDWQGAAKWLMANTPEHARILTRNKSLGLWSGRLQQHVQFERLSASELEDAIRTTRAQYIALGYWGAGALMPVDRMNRNPVYSFEQVADFQGVRIYRVIPNRSGHVSDKPPDDSSLAASFGKDQKESDLGEEHEITRSHLLRRAGRAAEAIPALEQRVQRSPDVPYALELANCLIDVGEYHKAIAWYHRAAELPGGDLYRINIAAGIQVAEQFILLHDPNASSAVRTGAALHIAASHIEMGRYEPALTLIDNCLELSPSNPACLYVRGTILQRMGRNAEAVATLEAALAHGARDAAAKLLLLKTADVIDASAPADIYVGERRIVVDPTTSQDHLNLATLAIRDGIHGFGLRVLEQAQQRFPDDATVSKKLGELYELFGEWELAAAAWNRAIELQPDPQTTSLLRGVQQKMSQRPRP